MYFLIFKTNKFNFYYRYKLKRKKTTNLKWFEFYCAKRNDCKNNDYRNFKIEDDTIGIIKHTVTSFLWRCKIYYTLIKE